MAALQVEQQHAGILHRCLDLAQEGHGLSAVDEPVIVGQRHVHHRPHLDLRSDTGISELSTPTCMLPSCEFREELAFSLDPESWVQALLDVSCLAKLLTHPGWVHAPDKVRSLPGTVPYHKGYNLTTSSFPHLSRL